MGKGKIVENLGEGKYLVQILYGSSSYYQVRLNALNSRIADLVTKIADETDPVQKEIYRLQKLALEKQKQQLIMAFSEPQLEVWCVEKIDDLAVDQEIATIEIPGERQQVNIRPAYEDQAQWDQSRDGQLRPSIAFDPWSALYGQMILPGWQKWKPNYRIAIISDIDYQNDTCAIKLLPASSSQQNLNVNQGQGAALGQSGYEYEISTAIEPGWEQFKSDNPSHPLVTNSAQPEALPSNDALIKQIRAIDLDVNSKHIYATDASYRGIGDDWRIMSGDDPRAQLNERGDCEDFALTKADKLINELGLSPKNMQIATCYTQKGEYHALLLVPTTNHGILVLDINTFGLTTKEKIDQSGYYLWDKFLINGNQWAVDVVSILTVPIEYMNCNANAFIPGDQVVVEFTDQDFEQPKVIGFASNPADCAHICYSMDGFYTGYEGRPLGWNPSSDVFISRSAQISLNGYKRFMAAWSWADGLITVAGGMAHTFTIDEFGFVHQNDNLSDKTQQYNSLLDSVSNKNDMASARGFQYGCRISDTEGLLPGGCKQISGDQALPWNQRFDGSDTVRKYNQSTNSWQSRQDLSEDSFHAGVFSIGGIAYLTRGYVSWLAGNWQFLSGSKKFNDVLNTWSSLSDSFPNWFEPNCWSAGEKGWIAQGHVMTQINSDDFHVNYVPPGNPYENWITSAHFAYDPVTQSWSSKQKNTASGGFGWIGRGDLSESSKDGAAINVALGISGESGSGDYFKLSTETWHNTKDADLGGGGEGRYMGGTAGGVGMQ